MCEAFLRFLQCCVRIYGSLMGLTQSLEKIYVTAFIRVCLGEFFVHLSALLESEFTEEWDDVSIHLCNSRASTLLGTEYSNQFC